MDAGSPEAGLEGEETLQPKQVMRRLQAQEVVQVELGLPLEMGLTTAVRLEGLLALRIAAGSEKMRLASLPPMS